jgi:hypothetical protein
MSDRSKDPTGNDHETGEDLVSFVSGSSVIDTVVATACFASSTAPPPVTPDSSGERTNCCSYLTEEELTKPVTPG